jgi:hypothetical protein
LLVIFGLLALLAFSVVGPAYAIVPLGGIGLGIYLIVLGIIAIVGARRVVSIAWAIILIIIGLISGSIAGFLVLLGGIIGLIAWLV